MKKLITIAFAALALTLGACKNTSDSASVDDASEPNLELCDDCGHVEGTMVCCVDGTETCGGCELAKGSPGCCKIEKGGGDVALCDGCGQIEGSDECCDPNAKTCGCGKAKGAPGCCK